MTTAVEGFRCITADPAAFWALVRELLTWRHR